MSNRHSSAAVSVREVTEDTIINGWKFEKGGMVMIPIRANHQDPEIYGERVDKIVPDRFLKDFIKTDSSDSRHADGGPLGKTGPSIKSMKPFGGGVTLCPGRHFAGNQSLAFIATALRRFDIQLVEGQKEAKPLTSYPLLGVCPPDHEIFAKIRLRE
jgi:cytochrome P450